MHSRRLMEPRACGGAGKADSSPKLPEGSFPKSGAERGSAGQTRASAPTCSVPGMMNFEAGGRRSESLPFHSGAYIHSGACSGAGRADSSPKLPESSSSKSGAERGSAGQTRASAPTCSVPGMMDLEAGGRRPEGRLFHGGVCTEAYARRRMHGGVCGGAGKADFLRLQQSPSSAF